MPVLHEATKTLQQDGSLQVIGLIQEQHPERCKLFMQWKQMDWPVLIDPLNRSDAKVVPIPYAIDEHGIIRAIRPKLDWLQTEFITTHYDKPVRSPAPPKDPNLTNLVERKLNASEFRALGDFAFLKGQVSTALQAYYQATLMQPDFAANHFRLGVALKTRYDYENGKVSDFSKAVQSWSQALSMVPSQYIWRRRLQQYGPRLDKPYNFYFWIDQARKDILARGDTPFEIKIEPRGSEIAAPLRKWQGGLVLAHPDPQKQLPVDGAYVNITAIAVPSLPKPGQPIRLHVTFTLTGKADWNNEADTMQIRLQLPEGTQGDEIVELESIAITANSHETRTAEFELQLPKSVDTDTISIELEAFYALCLKADGQCIYYRRDHSIQLQLSTSE